MRFGAPPRVTREARPAGARVLRSSASRRFAAWSSGVRVSTNPVEGITSESGDLDGGVSDNAISKRESHRIDNPCIES